MHDRSIGVSIANARGWVAVAILLFLYMVSAIDRTLISLLVEPLKADLALTEVQIGLVQGLGFGLFYAFFGVPMGYLIDRYPRKIVLWGGVTIWSIAAAACGLATSFTSLLVSRFGVGAGEATLSPAAYSIVSDHFPPHRLSFALGVFGVGGILGISAALTLGSMVITWAEDLTHVDWPLLGALKPWQMAFIMTGLPGLLFALFAFLIPEAPRRAIRHRINSGNADGFLNFLRANRKILFCHFTAFGAIAILSYGMIAWTPVFLMRRFGLSILETGSMLGIVGGITGVAGMLFNGWYVDRCYAMGKRDIHLRYYVMVAGVSGITAIVAFAWAPSPWLFLLPYAFVTFLQPFTGPAAALIQILSPPEYRGRTSSLFLLVMNLMGMCLGPTIVAVITEHVLRDPARVGDAIALSFLFVSPVAALLFLKGADSLRTEQEAGIS